MIHIIHVAFCAVRFPRFTLRFVLLDSHVSHCALFGWTYMVHVVFLLSFHIFHVVLAHRIHMIHIAFCVSGFTLYTLCFVFLDSHDSRCISCCWIHDSNCVLWCWIQTIHVFCVVGFT
jgi:hypothetical protein